MRRRSRRHVDWLKVALSTPWWWWAGCVVLTWGVSTMPMPNIYLGVGIWTVDVLRSLQVPLIMVFSWLACASAIRHWRIGRVHAARQREAGSLLERSQRLSDLRRMSWRDFERAVGEAYRRQGYRVRENEIAGADDGIDLVLERGHVQAFVQCKRWRARTVDVSVVREFLGVVVAGGARHGIVVSAGDFTAPATRFAAENGIELVGGDRLLALFDSVRTNISRRSNSVLVRSR